MNIKSFFRPVAASAIFCSKNCGLTVDVRGNETGGAQMYCNNVPTANLAGGMTFTQMQL